LLLSSRLEASEDLGSILQVVKVYLELLKTLSIREVNLMEEGLK